MQSGLDREREHPCVGGVGGTHASPLDEQLRAACASDRRLCRHNDGRSCRGFRQLTGETAREHGARRAHTRLDRRARILRLELSHLPLTRQHPQRIEHARARARTDVGIGALRLEARPARDRRSRRCARERRLCSRRDDDRWLRLNGERLRDLARRSKRIDRANRERVIVVGRRRRQRQRDPELRPVAADVDSVRELAALDLVLHDAGSVPADSWPIP